MADAADYGVPQHRHRVFFVGFRSDVTTSWHFPLPTHSGESLAHAKNISGSYWREHRIPSPSLVVEDLFADVPPNIARWRTVRDALTNLPDPQKRHSVPNHIFQGGARSYPGHTGSPIDEPAKALKAGGHGVPGGENMIRFQDQSLRYFTAREAARVQTFPDDWIISGTWSESMRQIGNAVPVRLAHAVADSVMKRLTGVHHGSALQSTR